MIDRRKHKVNLSKNRLLDIIPKEMKRKRCQTWISRT